MIPNFQRLLAERATLTSAIHARNTQIAYSHDWKRFVSWCEATARAPFPASTDTVAYYATSELDRGCKVSTVIRYVSSISFEHRRAGHASPVSRDVWWLLEGAQHLRREQPQQKAALGLRQIQKICMREPARTPTGLRDRAILLFGFASALRRSSLVALDLADVRFVDCGMLVTIHHEKQDQAGVGRCIGIPLGKHSATCPVRALRAWLAARGPRPGPLFSALRCGRQRRGRMHPNRIALLVKVAVESIGLDPRRYGAHSLRAGFVTEGLEAGVNEIAIATHTGHRSLSSLRKYFRSEDPFRSNALAALDL